MKMIRRILSVCLVLVMVFMLTIAPAHASNDVFVETESMEYGSEDAIAGTGNMRIGPENVVVGTKSTEYGTITATRTFCLAQECPTYPWISVELCFKTSINSSVPMRKITTSYEAKYVDTGLTEETQQWSDSQSATNTKEHVMPFTIFAETGRPFRLYTSHQVLYTKAYVLYVMGTYGYDGIW